MHIHLSDRPSSRARRAAIWRLQTARGTEHANRGYVASIDPRHPGTKIGELGVILQSLHHVGEGGLLPIPTDLAAHRGLTLGEGILLRTARCER